jgi:hypothetical protein
MIVDRQSRSKEAGYDLDLVDELFPTLTSDAEYTAVIVECCGMFVGVPARNTL